MKFDKHLPTERLRPYIRHFVISESELESEYKVFPSSGLVIGFQYSELLSILKDNTEHKLAPPGITGISNGYKIFKKSKTIGTVLVFFTETGFMHFISHPSHELFNLNITR